MPIDKVKPLKLEDGTNGTEVDFSPTETNPSEDYIASKGLAFENQDNRKVDLDGPGNIQFQDVTETTPITVRQLRTAANNLFNNTSSGLTATNVQDGIDEVDAENHIQQVIWVKKNPGHKDFSSITSALASITDASSSKRYVINVAPGIYSENNPITLKSYVHIVGQGGPRATQILAANANQDLLLGADNVFLGNLFLNGVTGSGKCLINYAGSLANNTILNVHNVRFGSTDTIAKVTAGNFDTLLFLVNCTCGNGDAFNNGFYSTSTGTGSGYIRLFHLAATKFATPYPSYIAYTSGAGNKIDCHGGEIELEGAVTTGTCFQLDNGAHLDLNAVHIEGFGKGIHAINSGTAPKILASSVDCVENTIDLQIDHTGTTGCFFGIAERSKIVNNAPNGIQLCYQDHANGDLNNTRILATKGFATGLTTLVSSNTTTQILSTDSYAYIITGSTLGQILQLPDATTLRTGHQYFITNSSSVQITTRQYGGSNSVNINSTSAVRYILIDNSTSAGVWGRTIMSSSSLIGIAPVLASYGANALTGRYLEIWPSQASDTSPFIIPSSSLLIGLVLGSTSSSTCTVSVYKTTDLVNPIASISLAAQTENINNSLNVILNALDKLAIKVSSGSVLSPRVSMYISGT